MEKETKCIKKFHYTGFNGTWFNVYCYFAENQTKIYNIFLESNNDGLILNQQYFQDHNWMDLVEVVVNGLILHLFNDMKMILLKKVIIKQLQKNMYHHHI